MSIVSPKEILSQLNISTHKEFTCSLHATEKAKKTMQTKSFADMTVHKQFNRFT